MILTVGNQNKDVVKSLKTKTWIIMKLTIVLLLFFTFQVSAKSNAQRITIVKNNIHLSEVFKAIEQQTGFHFFYDKDMIQKTTPINVALKDATLEQALSACLKGQQLTYTIVRNTIVIRKGQNVTPQSVSVSVEIEVQDPPPIQVHGQVMDENGNPLANSSVTIKGTNQGVTTNTNGVFTISVPNGKSVLIISFTGYQSQEILVGNQTTVKVNLVRVDNSLNAVVVTALGIKRQEKSLGYATATVTGDELSVNRTPNIASGLEGKIAGVNISTMGTGPAGSTKIRIRGQSSFSSQNSPLIVLNGVPMDNTNYAIGGENGVRSGQVNSSDGGDGLSSINPDDVESMTVLKGAAASALYGSRAKDGVIMITTKSGSTKKGIGVDYNINYTEDTPLDFTDFQYEYGQGERGVRPNSTPYPQSGVWSFGEKFEPGMTQILFDSVYPYKPVYHRYKKFYNTGKNLTNTLRLSNGGENGGFSLSLSNTDNTGIIPKSKFNRKSINLGFNQNIAKGLTVQGNAIYSNEKNTNPPQVNTQDMAIPTVMYTLANSMPFDALKEHQTYPNGDEIVIARFLVRNNPYYSAYHRFENIRRDRLIGNISLRYEINNWMYIQGRIAQDMYTRDQDYNIPNGYAPIPKAPTGFVNGSYTQDVRQFRERNYDFLFGVKQKIKDFGVDITLGGNQMYRKQEYNSVTVQDFVQPGLYTIMNGRIKNPLYDKNERKVNSLYGDVQFTYKSWMFLNITGRNDWFSTLAPANRSIFYPSATLSFVFSEAFRDNLPSWINFGKLRAGYAEVGDDNVAPYSNVLYYSVNNDLFPNPSGQGIPVGGINASTIPNPNLKPLRISEAEAGIELGLFNNKIGFDFSYYHKITKDQILAAQVSDASSYTSKLINVGRSMNQGLEMLLRITPVQTSSFKWEVILNASYNTSKVLKLGLTPEDTVITVGGGGGRTVKQVVGKPIGALYTFLYKRDEKGRQVFDENSGKPLREDRDSYVGNILPKYFGGITNTFTYKGIILTALVDFKLGAKMIAGSNMNALRHGLHKMTLNGREEGYVIGDGVNPDGKVNTTKADLQPFYETPNVLGVNEDFVFNSGFWKLRQITLGYDFTKYLKNIKFIKGLRLSAVANNVLIIKKWTENMDPENTSNISDNQTGLDFWTALPPTRSIGFNLSVKF